MHRLLQDICRCLQCHITNSVCCQVDWKKSYSCNSLLFVVLPYLLHDLYRQSINWVYGFQAFVSHQRQGCNPKKSMKGIHHIFWAIWDATIIFILQCKHFWLLGVTTSIARVRIKTYTRCSWPLWAYRALHVFSSTPGPFMKHAVCQEQKVELLDIHMPQACTAKTWCRVLAWQKRIKRMRAGWSIQCSLSKTESAERHHQE